MKLLSAALLACCFSFASCFNPDYGAGGFACVEGECPAGFACASEGTRRICRSATVARDAAADRRRDVGLDRRVDLLANRPDVRADARADARGDAARSRTSASMGRGEARRELAGAGDATVFLDKPPCVPKTYYKDGDGDGYGAPQTKTEACTPPSGYVDNSLDCDDQDGTAHPGQQAFYVTPTLGTKSFDYDCDTVAQLERPLQVSCAPSASSCTGDGWVSVVPACGQSGLFATCVKQRGVSGCTQSTSPQVQRCR